ncbi:MAG: glycosyltransferase family 9 protein [Candidatus Eremiobacterota bacterium]
MRGSPVNVCTGGTSVTISKILVIRIDRIGDLVCTVPAIKSVKNHYPGAVITALLSSCNASLLADTGLVDEIIVWYKGKKDIIKNLKDRHFDIVLVFSPVTEAYAIALKTGSPVRAGIVIKSRIFTRLYASFCLTGMFLLNQEERLLKHKKVIHEVEKGFRLLEILGIKEFNRDISIPIPDTLLTGGREYLKSVSFKGQQGIIALPLCCRYNSAGWNTDNFTILARELREKFPDYLLFITFGKKEEQDGKALQNIFNDIEGVAVKGDIPLQMWMSYMKYMSAVISIDSGAVHLAASCNVPSVVLYPKDIYELCRREWTPWNVPCRQLIIKDFKETSGEIITALGELLER